MCVLPDLNYVAVATTERDLIFYDVNAHTYTGSLLINQFPGNLTALDYRMNMTNALQSAIFCGDSLGNVFIFQAKDPHRPMFHISDQTQPMNSNTIRTFSFPRTVQEEYRTVSATVFCRVHSDSVVQIKWIADLALFVSCALTSKKSLFIGDVTRKAEKYASVRKGFAALDYCKASSEDL